MTVLQSCFLHCKLSLPCQNQVFVVAYIWLLQVHVIEGVFLNYVPEHGGAMEVAEDDLEEIQEQEVLSWAVKIKINIHKKEQNRTDLDEKAELISLDTGLLNYGQVGELSEHYLFVHENYNQSLNRTLDSEQTAVIRAEVEKALEEHEEICWFIQQTIRRRTKRAFNDPGYIRQWHLHNDRYPEMDINVTKLWEYNITGSGVVIAVIDDGLEWNNPDIEANYCPEGSWDLNSNDGDPSPESSEDGTKNRHGTRCAGEIAAAANDFCAVGVAYNSRISGVRLLDGPMTDSLEATAFNKFMQINDIYSCSWGPDDDGKTIDGPHPLAQTALKHGVSVGRKGYGSIFVVASGNGGKNKDNCNFDGYANSIYTVTIGAIDERGRMPYYAEECAAMLAVTFSSGSGNLRSIVTTDWTSGQGTGCTTAHTGTSAAAPLAAGIIGLMLQARSCLTWRDIQHIIVFTSVKVDEANAEWYINKAGFHHSHKHGFGLLNAWRLVNAARVWPPVPWMTSISSSSQRVNVKIPGKGKVSQTYLVSLSDADNEECATIEHVVVTVTISHKKRGDLEVVLFCPSGTKSVLGARRVKDLSSDGFKDWSFSTVRCWGEKPVGTWQLHVYDHGKTGSGILVKWKLTIYGSQMTMQDIKERQIMVEEAMGGEFLLSNETLPCPPSLALSFNDDRLISPKTLKMLLLGSFFAVFMTIYYSLEQAFCNEEDKDEYAKQTLSDSKTTEDKDIKKNDLHPNTGETRRLLDVNSESEIANNSIFMGNSHNSVHPGNSQTIVQSQIFEPDDVPIMSEVGDYLSLDLSNSSRSNSSTRNSNILITSCTVAANNPQRSLSINNVSNRNELSASSDSIGMGYSHWSGMSDAKLFNTEEATYQGTL